MDKGLKKKIAIFIIITILLIALDQITKQIVVSNYSEPYGNSFMSFTLTENTGMFLGLNEGNTRNIIITIVILCLILHFIIKQNEMIDKVALVGVSLINAGALSQLIDRFIRHHIVDFIKIWKFPIFNIADCIIVIGWILFIVSVFRTALIDRSEHVDNKE